MLPQSGYFFYTNQKETENAYKGTTQNLVRTERTFFCNSNFEETVVDVLEENPELINDEDELKLTVMSRMLSEHLDYGPMSETNEEMEDGERHSILMSMRADFCDDIAEHWVNGKYSGEPTGYWLRAAQKDLDDAVCSHYLGVNYEAAIEQIWKPDGEKIKDEQLAEFIGRYKIIEIHHQSTATTFDKFWEEVNISFSGYPLDGSPFGAAEAEKYARFTWDRYGDS